MSRINEVVPMTYKEYDDLIEERDTLRAELAEARRQLKEVSEQEPVAMVVHHNPPFGAVYKVDWYTKYRDLPWRVATGRETDEERATLGDVSPNAEYDEFIAAIDAAILSATDSEVKK